MYGNFKQFLTEELTTITSNGTRKTERVLNSPQQANVRLELGEMLVDLK